jgi:hypothetical protein
MGVFCLKLIGSNFGPRTIMLVCDKIYDMNANTSNLLSRVVLHAWSKDELNIILLLNQQLMKIKNKKLR